MLAGLQALIPHMSAAWPRAFVLTFSLWQPAVPAGALLCLATRCTPSCKSCPAASQHAFGCLPWPSSCS